MHRGKLFHYLNFKVGYGVFWQTGAANFLPVTLHNCCSLFWSKVVVFNRVSVGAILLNNDGLGVTVKFQDSPQITYSQETEL